MKALGTRAMTALPNALMVLAGFVTSRGVVNILIPKTSGYIRAAAQAGAGVALSQIAGTLQKGTKGQQLADSLLIGGLASGLLTIIDTVTAQKYSKYYMSDDVYYVPEQAYNNYLPETSVSGYFPTRGMRDYVSMPAMSDLYKPLM